MATVDNRLLPARASTLHLDQTLIALGLTDANTIAEVRTAIDAQYTDAQPCVQCGGAGFIDGTADGAHFPNSTAATLRDESGNLDPNVVCPLCMGDQVTEGAYRAVLPTGVITYEPIP